MRRLVQSIKDFIDYVLIVIDLDIFYNDEKIDRLIRELKIKSLINEEFRQSNAEAIDILIRLKASHHE